MTNSIAATTPLLVRGGYPDAPPSARPNYLLADHALQLTEISSAVRNERGYRTEETPSVLASYGYCTKSGKPLGWVKTAGACLLLPVFNAAGEEFSVQVRPDNPRIKPDGKVIKYETPSGFKMCVDVHPRIRQQIGDPSIDLHITEGIKDGDSAVSRGLCCVALLGVWNWRGSNDSGGATVLPDWEHFAFKAKDGTPRRICLWFDSDSRHKPGVRAALKRFAAWLRYRGAKVIIGELPDGPPDAKGVPSKTGLYEHFERGGTVESLLLLADEHGATDVVTNTGSKKATRSAKQMAELEATGLPHIETGDRQLETQIRNLSEALGAANQRDPRLFHGPQGLSRISSDKNGRALIIPASVEIVQDAAAKAANWIHTSDRQGILNTMPPKTVCAVFAQTPHNWQNIWPIDSVVTAPFFAPDGTLCATHGYHSSAGVWLDLPSDFEMPDTTPTKANVLAAINLIVDKLLGEVAFADNASRAHAVAQMLLPLVRRMINECTPLHLWDAPTQSTGKSYGAEVCIAPFDNPEPMDEIAEEAEWSKALLATFVEGRMFRFIDNIKGKLSSQSLASYITSPSKTGRVLGLSRMVPVSTLGAVWVATSNNARLDRDAQSRCVLIRLDTGLEQPEDKAYSNDPKAYIQANRAVVIGALVTIVRHWQAQGSPLYAGGKSRFKAWGRIIGGILQSADIPGFLENVDEARENFSPETDVWREFACAWWQVHGSSGVTAKDLLPLALKCEGMGDVIGEKDGGANRLGNLLNARRDQIFLQIKISRDAQKTKLGVKWRLVPQFDLKNEPEELKRMAKGDTSDTGDTLSKRPCDTRNNSLINEIKELDDEKRVNSGRLGGLSSVSSVSPGAMEVLT